MLRENIGLVDLHCPPLSAIYIMSSIQRKKNSQNVPSQFVSNQAEKKQAVRMKRGFVFQLPIH